MDLINLLNYGKRKGTRGFNQKINWTKSMDKKLLEITKERSLKEAAKEVGAEYKSAHSRFKKLTGCGVIEWRRKNGYEGLCRGFARGGSWTEEEDAILIEHYREKGGKYCASLLKNRTLPSVQNRVHKLRKAGLMNDTMHAMEWTEEEEAIIIKHYNSKGARYCAELLNGRAVAAVRERAGNLRERGEIEESWIERVSDDEFLKMFERMSAKEIAKELGVSEPSVRSRFYKASNGGSMIEYRKMRYRARKESEKRNTNEAS